MSDLYQIEISKEQREFLLRGLRYVRSAETLHSGDFSDDEIVSRDAAVRRLDDLAEHIRAAPRVSTAEV